MLDRHAVSAVRGAIGDHSLLDPDAASSLAEAIVARLGLRMETHELIGAEYLGGVSIFRWVSDFRKR